jgi:pilus assembly protein CpaC
MLLRTPTESLTMFRNAMNLSLGGLLVAAVCAALFALPVSSFAAKGELVPVDKDASKSLLKVTLGKADVVTVEGDISDVMVANPDLIDVTAIQSNKLYVVGVQVGDTNIIALDDKGNVVKRIDVHVTYDLMAIQGLVNELFPDEKVKIGAIHDQVLLTGTASNPEVSSKIANLVGHYVSDLQDTGSAKIDELVSNQLQVKGEQQVMLQVRIVEASRTALKELGVDTSINRTDELATQPLFGLNPPFEESGVASFTAARGAGAVISQDPFSVGRGVFDSGIAGIGLVGITLQALEDRNLAHILAEPNLSAVSGETAGFLAGGEFPVPVGRDQVGNVIIEFKKFGVSLNFKPVVLNNKRISLQMDTEVSSLDFTAPISTSDLIIPGLNVRRADTTVEIQSGGSLMIAGLMKSDVTKGLKGLPGIADAPILGDLMSSKKFERNETELVVIVTPYLVEPYAETERAKPVPKQHSAPLSNSFADNIRRVYRVEDPALFEGAGSYGYLLD